IPPFLDENPHQEHHHGDFADSHGQGDDTLPDDEDLDAGRDLVDGQILDVDAHAVRCGRGTQAGKRGHQDLCILIRPRRPDTCVCTYPGDDYKIVIRTDTRAEDGSSVQTQDDDGEVENDLEPEDANERRAFSSECHGRLDRRKVRYQSICEGHADTFFFLLLLSKDSVSSPHPAAMRWTS
ncbi:hypothetical protein T310_10153, partial [Rasamsonia emersonii CBS 393.64]